MVTRSPTECASGSLKMETIGAVETVDEPAAWPQTEPTVGIGLQDRDRGEPEARALKRIYSS